MLQNLRSKITRYFDQQSLTAQLLLIFGLLLLLAYSAVDKPDIRLWTAVVYLGAGAGSLLLEAFFKRSYTDQIVFIAAGIATGFGLVALPAEGVWTLWMALVVFALIPTVPSLRRPIPLNVHLAYIAITVVGAVAGSIISENAEQFEDLWILGLGTLAVGHGILLNARQLSGAGAVKPSAGQSEADEKGIRLLAAQDLFDLSMRIHDTVDGLVRAAHAINDVTAQQTLNANEQTDFIESTNSKMDDFLKLAERITDSAREITKTARESTEVSEEGKAALQQAMGGMEQIRMQVQAIGNNILMLAQLTRRIDEIITSVSEIATQSNLLALNASIEAARAGAQGRGFAVVADEVRSLSQQSTNAAHQVRDILAQIQNAVRQTVAATEAGVHGAEEGVAKAKQADKVMMQLADNVNSTHKAVRLIYDGIREQADGLEEIAFSIERIERITQQSLASTRMVTTVSTNLNRLAEDLQEVVLIGQSTAASSMEEIDSSTLIPIAGDQPGQ